MDKEKKELLDPRIEKLLSAGAHFGLTRTRRHPSVKKYILTTKNRTDIINAQNIIFNVEKAKDFLASITANGGKILFVGTKPEIRDVVTNFAEQCGGFYMTYRWVGGTLTNLAEIKKRLSRLEEIRKSKETGDINKYTKKERGMMEKEAEKLNKTFVGLSGFNNVPDVLVIVDSKYESIAKKEANRMNIPIVAVVNTDTDIKNIDYPIVANDSSISSVSLVLNMLLGK